MSIYFLALVQLKLPISIEDENKARICLPDDDNPVADDQECYATGWGLLEYDGFPSDYLREVKVNRVSPDVCNDTNAYDGDIDETMTCAGFAEGQKDSCTNDSGGSLVCKVDGKFSLNRNSSVTKKGSPPNTFLYEFYVIFRASFSQCSKCICFVSKYILMPSNCILTFLKCICILPK